MLKPLKSLLVVIFPLFLASNSFASSLEKTSADNTAETRILLGKALDSSKSPSLRCEAISLLGDSQDRNALKAVAGLVSDPDVQVCAAQALGTAPQGQQVPETATTAGGQNNEFAEEALIKNVESYLGKELSKGPYENNLKARLAAINAIWSLGEIGNPKLMEKLSDFYDSSDDVIKMNLIISMGKLKENSKAAPHLFSIASNPRETEVVRAIAFEVLEKIGAPSTIIDMTPSENTGIEKGDIIYTGGVVGSIGGWFSPDLPIGHAGIFAGTKTENGKIKVVIGDCVPNNFKPGGVRNVHSFYDFTHHYMYPYYGNRTTKNKPTASQRNKIVALTLSLGEKGFKYSNSHFSQKGPVEFDCVGYTEYIYEQAGINPTDDSYESGAGWPLTPYEQFDATVPNTAPVSPIIIPNNQIIIPGPVTVIPYAGTYKTINSMVQPFAGDVEDPEIPAGTSPQPVN